MLSGLALAFAAGLCFAVGAGLFASVGASRLPFLVFLSVGAAVGLALSLVFVVDWSAAGTATRVVELCAWIGAGAVANVAGHRAMAGAMAGGRPSIAWAIGQGGQAIPFVASAAVWGERPGVVAWLGVVTVLAGVGILARTRTAAASADVSRRGLVLALVAFLCYGLNNTLMSVPSHWDGWADAMRLRLPVTLAVFALCGAACSRWPDRRALEDVMPRAVAYGVLLVVCFGCVYLALDDLGRAGCAGAFWLIASGTGVVSYAAYERVSRGRALSTTHAVGIAVVVLGIGALGLG